MSIETREQLVNDPRLVFSNGTQRADLLDPNKTNTWLIDFLADLLNRAGHPILLTAINTDHAPGTWHNPPGRACDLWHADWQATGDAAIIDVMQAIADIGATRQPLTIEVGLSGEAAYLQTYVSWPDGAEVFVETYGDDNDHVHVAVGVPT